MPRNMTGRSKRINNAVTQGRGGPFGKHDQAAVQATRQILTEVRRGRAVDGLTPATKDRLRRLLAD
jgi:hypothetical protein